MKQETNPLVSIVIPVYNGENYVKFAIESALAQTYSNLEILVIDDGSSDGTEEICKSYGDKIRYIKKKNGGVSSALNLALKEMKGEYFSWLSHDDTYEPEKVQVEIDYLRENGFLRKKVIVFSDYYLIDKKGSRLYSCVKPHDEIERKPEYSLLKGHINGLSLLIPKAAFDEFGDFDEKLICAQDYEMWRRMLFGGYEFKHIPELLVSTRCHAKQVTNTNPKVETEGNKFYEDTVEMISEERADELEGSKRNLYIVLAEFFKNGPYDGFARYCEERAEEILQKASKEVPKTLVSVIIPFYNRVEPLKRAIDSVLSQSHKKVELILVNDGSTDDLSDIKKIVKDNKNVILIDNAKNQGPSAARNAGMRKATGEYVAFLDSDDTFVEDKLSKSLQYAIASKAKILYTAYSRHDASGENKDIHVESMYGHCELEMMYSCRIATPTVMLNRQWVLDNNLFFDEDVHIGEDTLLWLSCMKNDTYLVAIDEPLTIVNTNENSAAYNAEDQILGLKTIVKFLLNDDYYSKYDFELSRLMKAYADIVEKNYKVPEGPVPAGLFRKMAYFAKNEGMLSLAIRIKRKVVSVVKG